MSEGQPKAYPGRTPNAKPAPDEGTGSEAKRMEDHGLTSVGLGRVELPTSRLSGTESASGTCASAKQQGSTDRTHDASTNQSAPERFAKTYPGRTPRNDVASEYARNGEALVAFAEAAARAREADSGRTPSEQENQAAPDGGAGAASDGFLTGSQGASGGARPASSSRRPLFLVAFMYDPNDDGIILYADGLPEAEASDLTAGNPVCDALDPDVFEMPREKDCPLVVFEAEQLTPDEWLAEEGEPEADPDYAWYLANYTWRKATAADLARAGLLASSRAGTPGEVGR